MSKEQETAMYDQPDSEPSTPKCEMTKDCQKPVTHIGNKGWVYCTQHAVQRREAGVERTRRMLKWELRWVSNGWALPHYERGPEPK